MSFNVRGVSPVVGTVLLIVVTVILAGTIGFFALQQGTPEPAPNLGLIVDEGYLYHGGGDHIDLNEVKASNESDVTLDFGNLGKYGDDNLFDPGDRIKLEGSGSLVIIHEETDTVLLRTEVD